MEIKDNELLRQFENHTETGLLAVEYAIQERKLFLTKLNHAENQDPESINEFLKSVMSIAEERKLRVVPTHPKITSFFRKNPVYKELLPPGIKI
ncbi:MULTISPECIES: N-acetyltransferase [Flavobacterium]|uniref:GNAT family N-acetyltransferase n=1 Tax=Flavobacterium TaxID=237 RepID=UPI00086A6739|nr:MULTISPECIES: N-acetyltransferase [Flavobacterium]MBN9283132.1 N-acetyltransferase [Flavobacterium sp.]ODS86635.1 MAG: acetyltransferase [Chryseobacterium sp. SCN 40-13]OJV67758.1 MAG: N-acetyltransferase [Flavobacterium sp. 40-81]